MPAGAGATVVRRGLRLRVWGAYGEAVELFYVIIVLVGEGGG